MIKVHLALGTDILTEGLRSILSIAKSVTLSGKSDDRDALNTALAIDPIDILFIDYQSNRFDEADVVDLLESYPELRIIGITQCSDVNAMKKLMRLGISGHLLHDCDANEIRQSVAECAQGKKFYCGQILDKVNESNNENSTLGCDAVVISDRELEVINLIAQGLTTKQIADKLHLSAHTVMTHRKNIMGKLGLNNAAGLITYAVKENLISPNKFLFS